MQDQGQAGDNLGALCRGLKREDIRKGQVRTAICALAVLFCLCVFCVCVCVVCVCVCMCVCVCVLCGFGSRSCIPGPQRGRGP